MEATHAFIKGSRGNGIFYRSEDFLVFFTIVSVIARKMELTILAFCPMFNHIHFLLKEISLPLLRSFIRQATSLFVKEYNLAYKRSGPVFQRHFGKSLKKGVKIILGCIAYVFNNPVAGKMFKTAIEYRWTLLAYHNSTHPFSAKLKKESCRNVMRIALKKVDYFFKNGKYLSYNILRDIFKDLGNEEKKQVIDYVISKYNFLAYNDLSELYQGFEKMITAIESNAGSEFDLDDEFGDHSCYWDMLSIVKSMGYKGSGLNFEKLPKETLDRLFLSLKRQTRAKDACINKFLHR
mgnify:CR=1 FL=1